MIRPPGTALARFIADVSFRKRREMLELLMDPFFALIDVALDRPMTAVAAASMVGIVVAVLLGLR